MPESKSKTLGNYMQPDAQSAKLEQLLPWNAE